MDKSREQFEGWFFGEIDAGAVIEDACWQAWQASRQELIVELPKPEEQKDYRLPYDNGLFDGMNLMLSDCQSAIERAGISHK